MTDAVCKCGHTMSCHGPNGCEVEISDVGNCDCQCDVTPSQPTPEESEVKP